MQHEADRGHHGVRGIPRRSRPPRGWKRSCGDRRRSCGGQPLPAIRRAKLDRKPPRTAAPPSQPPTPPSIEHERALLEKMMAGLEENPGPQDLRHHRSRALPRTQRHARRDTRRTLPARTRNQTGRPRHLHVGWQLLRPEPRPEHLDVEKSGGFLRIGLVHYNTLDEVDRLLAALREIVGV